MQNAKVQNKTKKGIFLNNTTKKMQANNKD